MKGLNIVSNGELRDAINDLYEHELPYLEFLENDYENHNHSALAQNELLKYMEIDEQGFTMSPQTYKTLLEDKNAHFVIREVLEIKKNLAYNNYPRIILPVENLISEIENELKVLRDANWKLWQK